MSRAAFKGCLAVLALVTTLAVGLGAGARATYGARTTADEPQYLLSATSLWEDGDLDISDELAAERYHPYHEVALPPQTRVLEDGRQISPHGPLLPILLAAPAGLAGWWGAKLAMAGLAGVLAAGIAWTAHHRLAVPPRVALTTAAVFALSAPLAVYGTQVYPEIPAALAVTLALAALVGEPKGWSGPALAAAVIALPWLAVKYVPVAAVLAIAGMVRLGAPWRRRLPVVLAVAGAVFLAVHLWIYTGFTPYATGDHFVGGEFTAVGTSVDLLGRSSRLLGLLVDRGFGIGAWQPAFFLVAPALGWALGRRDRAAGTVAAVVATGWLVATFVALTMHGWWFPGRQIVAVAPALALLVATWSAGVVSRQAVVAATGVAGMAGFAFLVAEGVSGSLTWVVDFGTTAGPAYRALSPLLPDYMGERFPIVLHAAWLVGLVALVGLGWRQGRRERRTRPAEGRLPAPRPMATRSSG